MEGSKPSLFASAVATAATSTSSTTSGLSWLQNDSFAIDVSKQVVSEPVSHRKRSRHEDKDRHKKSKKRRRSPKDYKKSESSKSSIYNQITNKTFREEVGLLPEHAFRIDPRPDRSNLGSNSLYRLQIPLYDREKTILLNGSKRDPKDVKKKRLKRYFSVKLKEKSSFVKRGDVVDTIDTFIPIINVEDEEEDVHLNNESKSTKKFETEDYFLKKTAEFNALLRINPKDINKWMEFVHFQDKMAEILYDKNENVTNAILEKKLSILDSAIKLNHSAKDENNIKLMVTRLQLVSSVWEPDKLNDEWKRLIFLYANNINIWLNYIQFVKSHLTYFNVNKVIKIYSKCFNNFNNILSGHFISHHGQGSRDNEEVELNVINIFQTFVTFLNESGYNERCIASWQALIELNLFPPKSLINSNALLTDWLTLFEPFWVSNCNKIGQNNSINWFKFLENKRNLIEADETSEAKDDITKRESEIMEKSNDRGLVWYEIETLRENIFWLPHTSFAADDDDDLDDSDRKVLFDDIKNCLFKIKSINSVKFLIESFFEFFESFSADDELNTGLSNKNWINSIDFINNVTSSVLTVIPKEIKSSIISKHVELIIKLINKNDKQVIKKQRKLIKTYLQEESMKMDLNLWNNYINFEVKIGGKRVESLRIYEMALELTFKRVAKDDYASFVKNYSFFLLEMKQLNQISSSDFNINPTINNDTTKTLIKTIATCLTGESVTEVTPTILLKITRNYQKIQQEDVINVNQVFLHSLLTYLTISCIDKVDTIYKESIRRCKEEQKRQLYVDYIQLHLLHLKCNFGSCRQLRQIIDEAVELFPLDDQLLSLLVSIDSHSAGNTKARTFFSRPASSNASKSEIFWINAIKLELNHLNLVKSSQELVLIDTKTSSVQQKNISSGYVGGIPRRIRSIFEKALSPANLPHNATLWKLYLWFEFTEGDKDKCRSVIYRSLQACPWMKDMYLMSVKYFPSFVQEAVDLMTEKEIRIRTLLEELNMTEHEECPLSQDT